MYITITGTEPVIGGSGTTGSATFEIKQEIKGEKKDPNRISIEVPAAPGGI